MPRISPHLRKPPCTRSQRLWLVSSLVVVGLLVSGKLFPLPHLTTVKAAQAATTSFSFTVAGDYAETVDTTANLNYIAHSGVKFHLAIGDFSYDASISATSWSSYVKRHLPANFPFEILAGNEDTRQITTYAANLPDHIGGIWGAYAKEYAFDYPAGAPLARFILISPGGFLSGYSYRKGSSHYNWLAQTIDAARAANIHWVIVAMHEHCIALSNQSCSIGSDLQDLLISKKVDLILQAHTHTYQASKQLALNGTTCTSVQINGYNASCVVNASTSFLKGSGSVIAITGTGGASLAPIVTSDSESGYFRTWMGSNSNKTWGVSRVTISATQLSFNFVGVSGNFSDSFTIYG